jgi:hypothetical protein
LERIAFSKHGHVSRWITKSSAWSIYIHAHAPSIISN